MIRSLVAALLLVGLSSQQYVQQQQQHQQQQQQRPSVQTVNVQASPVADDQIPAWYQMAKPVASRVQQLPQASPSYYERIEPTYEQRRGGGESPTYERPGIQTNQYANYPSYQNRQPYENLNALTSGASLSNLQASRRYPSAATSGGAPGSDMPYDSALKRYHKLLLKRRQWTTKIGRILASTTPMTPSTVPSTTTTEASTTTTKKMPKSLKSIYSTIIPKTTTTEEPSTSTTTTTTTPTTTSRPRVTPRLVGKPRGTFKPHGTRKGWRMWKKVTPKYVAGKAASSTTTEVPTTSTTTPTEPNTSASTTSAAPELPLIEEEQEVTSSTSEPSTTTSEPTTPSTTPTSEPTATTSQTSTTTTMTSEEPAEVRPTTKGLSRPIAVGHKWKPLRFKKPETTERVVPLVPTTTTTTSNKTSSSSIYNGARGLRLLEYLLPNTELLAAIKDVVAKFKASLDEAGIDQDVRLMGNQLKNTWQQLRTGTTQQGLDRGMKAVRQSAETSVTHFNYGPGQVGPPQPQPQPVVAQIPYHQYHQQHHPTAANMHRFTPGPMNEQIGRLFEKAVADAADQKQQQQLQHVQQQLAASRP